jgi:hypothetical protein
MNLRKTGVWIIVLLLGAAAVTATVIIIHRWVPRYVVIEGAVIRKDEDTQRELPIADAEITASDGVTTIAARSDGSGYFSLKLKNGVSLERAVDLKFRHPDYQPLDLQLQIGLRSQKSQLYVVAMKQNAATAMRSPDQPETVVSNIRVRYTVNSQTEENVGSAVKTFQVINRPNLPCNHEPPCSPNGNWKASSGSVNLDAGAGNEFRNVRASCIAGPCPFTRIDSSGFEHGGQTVVASAVDWSSTATFLVEAEVIHRAILSNVRSSYPVIFGRTLNFTLPPNQEGVSIEADVNHAPMVFPLGPALYLSWANCTARTNTESEKSTVYRCELKPGYRF